MVLQSKDHKHARMHTHTTWSMVHMKVAELAQADLWRMCHVMATTQHNERLISSSITANYNKETTHKAIITTIKRTSSFLWWNIMLYNEEDETRQGRKIFQTPTYWPQKQSYVYGWFGQIHDFQQNTRYPRPSKSSVHPKTVANYQMKINLLCNLESSGWSFKNNGI